MQTQKTIGSHQTDFDNIYENLNLDTSHIKFPLQDIEGFEWNRGPYGNLIFSFYYRRFTVHTISLLSVKDGHRILNIGCGSGSEEKNLAHLYRNLDLYSIDISNQMILAAKKNKCPSHLITAVAEDLPFPDKFFDRIVAREVIEHVLSPQKMLREISRCLKNDGIAVITTEYEDSLSYLHTYASFREKVLAPMLRVRLQKPAFKDEAPSIATFTTLAQKAELYINHIIWDGAMYHFCGSLYFQKLFRSNIIRIANFFSRLESTGGIDRRFCDQVKFVVCKFGDSLLEQDIRADHADKNVQEKFDYSREPKNNRVLKFLFKLIDKTLSVVFTAAVLLTAVSLTIFRSITRKKPIIELISSDVKIKQYIS